MGPNRGRATVLIRDFGLLLTLLLISVLLDGWVRFHMGPFTYRTFPQTLVRPIASVIFACEFYLVLLLIPSGRLGSKSAAIPLIATGLISMLAWPFEPQQGLWRAWFDISHHGLSTYVPSGFSDVFALTLGVFLIIYGVSLTIGQSRY